MKKEFGYVLPEVVDPSETICFQVHVPKDTFHIAAFMGQLWELTRWYNWQPDDAHTAIEVAEVWKQIYEVVRTTEGCEEMAFDIRQKDGSPCIIEKTTDGVTWVDAVNLRLCPPLVRTNDGVLQWYNPETEMWEDLDTGDERYDGEAPIPYPADPDGACLAAENITAVYQSALTEIRAGITASRDLVAIAAGISGIMTAFMPLAIVTTVAFALTSVALEVGVIGLDDMLDSESLENFKCSIFCNIEGDGSITADDYTALRAAMSGWAATVELEIIQTWLDGFGSVGLQRQAKAGGITTGDCEDCDCPEDTVTWNFHTWTTGDDPKVQTPLWGGGLSNTAAGTELGLDNFASEFIGGIYQGIVVVTDLLASPLSTYGTNLTVYAKRTGTTDFGYGHNKNLDAYIETTGGGWSGRIPVYNTSANEPVGVEFAFGALDLSTMTTQNRIVFYAYWGYEFEITRIELDGSPVE